MSVLRAALSGVGSALGSPALLLWLWLLSLLVAAPAAMMVGDSLHEAIGASRMADDLAGRLDLVWLEEYRSQARGLEVALTASSVSRLAAFDNLEAMWSGELFLSEPALVALGGTWALIWIVLSGGILKHYAERRPVFRLARLLEEGGSFAFRFLRLAVLSGLLYYGIFRFARWLFGRIEVATADVTVERLALLYYLAAAALVALLLALTRMVFDYAKIATVLEARSSMVLAALRGLRFVVFHPLRAWGLFLVLGGIALLVPGVYYLTAPGLEEAGWGALAWALAVGQLYLLARLAVRLSFYGGQLTLFETIGRASGRAPELGP